MKLCIAEKPSVAKEIANIIGANLRRDGYFEGNGYQVSWTFGHLCTLKTPDDYTPNWKWWNLNTLPMIPPRFGIKLIDNPGVQKQFDVLQKLIDNCESVINCGDAGIEGELIQRWVLTKAQSKKPLKRLWISSLTEEAIKEGFDSLRDGEEFNNLYSAGNSRAIGDWLLGMNATRLYTKKFADGKAVLSIGRVQTPTLALIVKRQSEIDNFKPETYWELKTNYRDVVFNSTKGKYKDIDEAKKIVEEIKDSFFTIKSYTKKKGKEHPPQLFDLTSLQVECNKKLNFTADQTLRYIQSLYEKKLVTYPRVDTTYLPEDQYPKIEGILKKLTYYSNFTEKILGQKIRKSKKVFDNKKVTDHHAIIPTGYMNSSISNEEKRVYDIITRRFISAFFPDCIVSNTTVIGEVEKYEFKATGKVIVEPGWRVLYPKKSESSDSKSQIMPQFEKGESGEHKPDLQEKQTTPPKSYTEATLLRAMETAGKQIEDESLREHMKENGIGRPSTRANIIETLFKRKYIQRIRKSIVPTQTGKDLINTIKNELLKSVELTGMWEKKLRQIEKGEYEASTFINEMKQMISQIVYEVKNERYVKISIQEEKQEAKTKKSKSQKTDSSDTTCPKCGKGKILRGKTAFGCSAFKEGCNFKVSFEQFGKKLTDKQINTLISKKKTGEIKGFSDNGKKYSAKLKFNNDFSIQITDKKEIKETFKCPKCKKGELLKGKTAYGCSKFKEGCDYIIKFDYMHKLFGTDILDKKIHKKLGV